MSIDPLLPQRVAVVIEQNKSGTWSIASYLISINGHRERRRIAVRDTYQEATEVLQTAWDSLAAED